MTNQEIAFHLIQEDIKYHRLVKHLAEMDVHIEFYPDIATAVQKLIAPDISVQKIEKWTDHYVQLMNVRTESRSEEMTLSTIPMSLLG